MKNKLKIESKINKTKLEISLNFNNLEDWKKYQNTLTEKLLKDIEVKGFRKGEAPKELSMERLNKEKVFNEAVMNILDLFNADLVALFKKHDTITRPNVSANVNADQFNLLITAFQRPELKITNYKDHKIQMSKTEVKDIEVDDEIEKIKNFLSKEEDTQKPSKVGDILYIDFEGKVDNKVFKGGSAKNHKLVLGSNSFIPGFEDQLLNKNVDETVQVNVTFPETYPNMGGKKAEFTVKINKILKKTVITDENIREFAKKQNIPSIDALKEVIKHNLENDQKQRANLRFKKDYIYWVINNNNIEVADDILQEEIKIVERNYIDNLKKQGMEYKNYLAMIKKTEEEIRNEFYKPEAKYNFLNLAIFDYIANLENISLTEEEVDAELNKLAKAYGQDVKEIKKKINLNTFVSLLKSDRVVDFLIKK